MEFPDVTATPRPKHLFAHYYGDSVRRLFLLSALLIMVGTLIFPELVPFVSSLGIGVGILLLVLFAGFTNPEVSMYVQIDIGLSALGFLLFQYLAFSGSEATPLYLSAVREAVAITFLFAFYFATKSLRSAKR